MIDKYEKYLETINRLIEKFFKQQEPYIFCKEGCSFCCETGSYPMAKVEFDYMMQGYEKLPQELKDEIKENIAKLKEEKNLSDESEFVHICPFLIDKSCQIYENRALICRSYGLMSYCGEEGEEKYKIPYCAGIGLNYHQVFDKEISTISTEMWKKTGIEVEPVSFNLGINFLHDNQETQNLGLDFGELKCFLDWFE